MGLPRRRPAKLAEYDTSRFCQDCWKIDGLAVKGNLMALNRELFHKDPLASTIPNDGVAKVSEPNSSQEWKTLRYELETFVCAGEYQRGMDRILGSYLRNLGETTQPAAWISGFYGSGKSHFVRVLEFLWRDTPLPDGASARGVTTLPDEIKEHFRELSLRSRKEGGLWSAAGTLGAGAGDSARLALLGIVFRSAHLPTAYPAAKFALWLRQNGFYEAVKAGVETAGKEFDAEVRQMYVSPILAQSLLDAYPGFADNAAGARALLKTQFPTVTDISDDEMVTTLSEVLALQSKTPGKLPCTLIVLDELQQFIADNPDRTLRVQNVVEACSSRFGSLLLFVATGQAALQGNVQLAKLQGRFTLQVLLSDNDVERVVREVVLRKAPNKTAELQTVLDSCSGEIDRHLLGTKIAPNSADREVLVADYPLLPSRRRFWERVLRAVDRAGAAGQLRTQLKAVHEATRDVANKPVGTVVAGDRIYDQLRSDMLSGGILLREMDEIIRREQDGTSDGSLRSRLCAAIFLIGQLSNDPGMDIGVRATKDVLADLLVEDLPAGSANLRQQIPGLLAGLVDKGSLMLLGEEYRLQTRESAEWIGDFRSRLTKVLADEPRIASDRATELKNACAAALQGLSFTHGNSKVARKIELQFSSEPPKADSGAIPIWIRDEWSVSEKMVREDAQGAGTDSPIVYVFLPRRSADDLRQALAAHTAANETLHSRANPSTQEGAEAKAAMQSRMQEQHRHLKTIIDHILKDAKVFQGGGNEVHESDLRSAVYTATQSSLVRLYPQFQAGDDPKWGKVVERVRQGGGDALSAVGYSGEAHSHPVCAAVALAVGAAGKKGIEIRKHFANSPYGWPKDTVDGALLALVGAGHLLASLNGTAVTARQIDQQKLPQTEFRLENVTVPMGQRIAVRKLLTDAGIPFKSDEEARALADYISEMIALAKTAGGEKPLPLPPSMAQLEELKALSGNELILGAWEARDTLKEKRSAWQAQAEEAAKRLPRWHALGRLLKHAQHLPVYAEVQPQVQAIEENRALLKEPNPATPLCQRLTDELREALQAALVQFSSTYTSQLASLSQDKCWTQLSADEQKAILKAQGLTEPSTPKLATESDVLAALDETPLDVWQHKTAAIAPRVAAALLEAAKRLEPKTVQVHLPSASLRTPEDVDAYLAEVRIEILKYIDAGNPVVI